MRRAADEVAIGLAQHRDLAAVRALIIAGLTQRWGDYRRSMNPDLEAFERAYSGASVIVATRHGEVVGCGILVAEAPGVARIVRMSVAVDLQRSGIGGNVLRALLERAVSLGYSEVVLETSADWYSAVSFYMRHGFTPTGQRDGDQHFRFDLARIRG
jgi:ribosomal protein S18 acetylase RimI-like enzyme